MDGEEKGEKGLKNKQTKQTTTAKQFMNNEKVHDDIFELVGWNI